MASKISSIRFVSADAARSSMSFCAAWYPFVSVNDVRAYKEMQLVCKCTPLDS